MDFKDHPPPGTPYPTTPRTPHFRKPSKPDIDEPHYRHRWRVLTWKARRIKRRYWVLIAAVVTASVVAAITAGIVEWKKRDSNDASIATLGTDVVSWFNNDLHGTGSNHTDSAILLKRPLSQREASNNCSSLNEVLLASNTINTTALLDWVRYLDDSRPQLYWVATKTGEKDGCSAISSDGQLKSTDCSDRLPAFCGSSAPIADQFKQDTSGRWQITVDSRGQELKGYRDRRSFRFLGVRYADKPSTLAHSTLYKQAGSHDATKPGPVCLQGNQGSDDCLFLNIWTPYLPHNGNTSTQLKPVIFWIHGGAFQGDTGTDSTFDGGNWASRGDVVTVTLNYRLGNLGFLVINGTNATGNYGLGDQITALDWAHEHIRDFGGDPDRIAIAGQSAGAASVRAMLGSPKARGKFSAAIMQSNLGGYGFAHPYSKYMSLNDYQANYTEAIMKQIKCNGRSPLPCVQKTSSSKLNSVQQSAFLVEDGIYITSSELNLKDTTSIANVPVIMGQMQGDAVFFVGDTPKAANLTAEIAGAPWNSTVLDNPSDFSIVTSNDTLIEDVRGNSTDAAEIAAVYNVTIQAGNDAMFRCVGQATAYAASQNNVMGPVWYYEMQRSYITYPSRSACNAPIDPGFPFGNPGNQTYKCHTGDNVYTFGNLAYTGQADRDGQDFLFAQFLADCWTAFARNHDPNPELAYLQARGFWDTIDLLNRAGAWPSVDSNSPAKRLLSTDSADVGFDEAAQCEDLQLPMDMFT